MSRSRVARLSVLVLGAILLCGHVLIGADEPNQPQDRGRGRTLKDAGDNQAGRGGRQFDRESFQKMMAERMKTMMMQRLEITEAEWKILEPRITKISELNREINSSGFRMFGARGMGPRPGSRGERDDRRPEGRGGSSSDRPQSAIAKAGEELSTVLEKDGATAEEIKARLTALRSAKEKAKQELAKAREELRKLLTVKQEAQLVLMGTLN